MTNEEWSKEQGDMSVKVAYLAMYSFLEDWYEVTKSDTLGSILGRMSLLPDGLPADSGIWEDWLDAVNKASSGNVIANLELK